MRPFHPFSPTQVGGWSCLKWGIVFGLWGLLPFLEPVVAQTVGNPTDPLVDQILEGIHDIQSDPTRLEEALPWIDSEQSRIQSELAEIEKVLTHLQSEVQAAEEQRQGLARDLVEGIEVPPTHPTIDFNRDIRPILSNNCVKCHGPDEKTRKAGLRLDLLAEAIGENRVIRPGQSQASPLFQRLVAQDLTDRMPPTDSGKELKPEQIDILKKWIDQGAPYQGHWAFEKPVKLPLPVVSKPDWVRNPIDSFVLAKLDELGLSPSREADKYTLARRLYLDLIGIPPTPTEVDDFIKDDSPQAYENLVDRLLASPHFGERWARIWLDLARYADTMGYEKDASRTIWRYRDWVIRALNEDIPFDQFTIQQLAGDLLENPSTDQIIATAFHRNTMTNTEGGTDNEEFRNAAVVDRVNTTMEVWMGLTMGCAQCHSHKYDPISNAEFYRFFAFFNQTEDRDLDDESPTLLSPNPEQKVRLDNLDQQINLSEKLLKTTEERLDLVQSDWEVDARSKYASIPRLGEWHSIGPFHEAEYDLARGRAFETPFAPEQSVLLEQTFQEGKLGWIPRTNWVQGETHSVTGEFSAYYLYRTIESATQQSLQIRLETSDPAKVFLNGEKISDLPGRGEGKTSSQSLVLPLVQGTNHLLVKLSNLEGNTEFLWIPESPIIPEQTWLALNLKADLRTENQHASLKAYHRSVSPEIQRVQGMLDALRQDRIEFVKSIPTTPILKELPVDQRRETYIQVKGNFLNPGEKVTAGVPEAFHDFPADVPLDRLGLAKWLVSRDNPLSARVVVNRYWAQFFGRGLVETAVDFGTQGDPPSNQALLDWLAVEFMEKDWRLKELCRTMVTSAVYRQSSSHRPENMEVDPFNRFLAQGPRFRLEGETVRDQMLRAAGLLSAKMYGPSVMPPQPEGVWQVVYSGDQWNTSQGEDRYRRGLYTFWRRTSPYPSMVTFDAPSREVCTSLRVKTNTPLQALVTLNDPAYVEAAQALARRVVQNGGTVEEKIVFAFRSVLVRPPDEEEIKRLHSLYESERDHFGEDPEAAKSLATDPLGPVDEAGLHPELAAWTTVGNVLFNLDETVTRL